jgi:hypothetical protein
MEGSLVIEDCQGDGAYDMQISILLTSTLITRSGQQECGAVQRLCDVACGRGQSPSFPNPPNSAPPSRSTRNSNCHSRLRDRPDTWTGNNGTSAPILATALKILTYLQSKQYLTAHTVDQGRSTPQEELFCAGSQRLTNANTPAHPTEIFSLTPTPHGLLSASGSSTLCFHSTSEPSFPLQQKITGAHKLGCHHVATARGGLGNVAASVGFGGEIKLWKRKEDGSGWELWWEVAPSKTNGGDVWAIALSADENYLACTTSDGRIHVWDLVGRERIQTYETGSSTGGGSFAMAVDLSQNGKLTASGHESGAVYVFNNDAGRMAYSLSGRWILSRLRTGRLSR